MRFTLMDPVNKNRIDLPVAPTSVEVQVGPRILSVSPINLGNIELTKGSEPVQFTWTGFFPGEKRKLPGVAAKNPNDIVKQLQKWTTGSRRRLRLIITGTPWNMLVFIDSFQPSHSGGHGDIQYTISFTEWRELSVKVEKNKKPTKPKKRPVTKKKTRTVTVKRGDTLWGFARRYTGKGTRWPEMWRINKSRSRSKNPHLIYPGEVFKIPSGW